MNKKKEVDDERVLKQHSALTTFTTEQEYFNIDTEKALFSILSDTQAELQRLFVEIYTPYIDKLFKDEIEKDKLLTSIYVTNSVSNIDIDYSKINTKEIQNISKEILRKKINAAHSVLIDKNKKEKYLLEIEGINVKQLTNKETKLIYQKEELIDLLDNIKDICKYETLEKYGRSKIIDFTSFVNKIGVNSKRLKDNIEKAVNVQLKFNYIDKKNLQVESISNLIASIIFIKNSKSTWMKYEIPEEILKYLLMPDMYAYLQEKKIHRLEGKYSIRLYSFLKDHIKFGHVTITKEQCTNFFKLPKTYLTSKSRFVNKFLNPTIADIQSKTMLIIDYELVPKFNFKEIRFTFRQGKEEVNNTNNEQNTFDALEIIEINDDIQKAIEKAKRNIYVARAWNKWVDNKIIKLLKEEGEDYTKEILIALYENLNENIKTTLVQYINGILKNKKINQTYKEENKKKKIKKKLEEDNILVPEIVDDSVKFELHKVTNSNQKEISDALSEYQIELQEVTSSDNNEETLYDKCVRENRLKPQNKFIVTYEEYIKEHKRYISQGYTTFKATELMNKMFIVKEEE